MNPNKRPTWRETPPVSARADCTICGGTGWELLDIGGTAGAKRCSCSALDRLLRLRDSLQVPPQYEHCSLANFHPETDSQARALEYVQRFADRYPRVSRNLFLSGPAGTGKTHLAVGLLRDIMRRFHDDDIRFAGFQDLVRFYLEPRQRQDSGSNDWKTVMEMPLLVIDGFGYEYPTYRVIRLAEQLLAARGSAGRRTVFTGDRFRLADLFISNPDRRTSASPTLSLLLALQGRTVVQLLSDTKIQRIDGEDYRLKGKPRRILFGP